MKRTLFILLTLFAVAGLAHAGTLIFNGHIIADVDTVIIDGGYLKGIAMGCRTHASSTAQKDSISNGNGHTLPCYSMYRGYGEHEILNVSLYDGEYLYVEYRNNTWLNDSRPYFRDIYGVVNGKIALIKTIEGKTITAQPERVEWPEE